MPENFFSSQPVREAPAMQPLVTSRDVKDPARPSVPNEPQLRIANIQGNIIGFNKDHVTMLFLQIDPERIEYARQWLARLAPFISSASEVLAFNRLFKEIRARRCQESRTVQATWINIGFSFAAMKQLTEDIPALAGVDSFVDEAFKDGMATRSPMLGDPVDFAMEGCQSNWVFGGENREADIVLIVASDSPSDLAAQIGDLEDSIYSGRTPDGGPTSSGVRVMYKQHGNTLPAPLTGHEHFGFLDGVSQPGLRGRISENPTDVLTPRQNPTDDEHLKQGKPGQDLLWPGEFIFGYPGQDPDADDIATAGPDSLEGQGPEWAKDGSFLVVRRLRQEVGKFHQFLSDQAATMGIAPELLGAKLVGRWASGSPIERTPDDVDISGLGDNDCANNNFEFNSDKDGLPSSPSNKDCVGQDSLCRADAFPTAKSDSDGARCPFSAHIRKAYPRDDSSKTIPSLNEQTTQTHRLLRRGIPFGNPYYPSTQNDSGNRGLLFACYQTSIQDQFEFVTQNWVNNTDFKEDGTGSDPILGQNTGGKTRERTCIVPIGGKQVSVPLPEDWVIPTGGGYFFTPSIATLCTMAKL